LGSENSFTETNGIFFFEQPMADRSWNRKYRRSGNRNALGFHIPKMWDKILDINKCHTRRPFKCD
jgi:hypothetical protein